MRGSSAPPGGCKVRVQGRPVIGRGAAELVQLLLVLLVLLVLQWLGACRPRVCESVLVVLSRDGRGESLFVCCIGPRGQECAATRQERGRRGPSARLASLGLLFASRFLHSPASPCDGAGLGTGRPPWDAGAGPARCGSPCSLSQAPMQCGNELSGNETLFLATLLVTPPACAPPYPAGLDSGRDRRTSRSFSLTAAHRSARAHAHSLSRSPSFPPDTRSLTCNNLLFIPCSRRAPRPAPGILRRCNSVSPVRRACFKLHSCPIRKERQTTTTTSHAVALASPARRMEFAPAPCPRPIAKRPVLPADHGLLR